MKVILKPYLDYDEWRGWKLSSNAVQKLRDEVQAQVDELIDNTVKQRVEKRLSESNLDEKIDSLASIYLRNFIRDLIAKKSEAFVASLLQELLDDVKGQD